MLCQWKNKKLLIVTGLETLTEGWRVVRIKTHLVSSERSELKIGAINTGMSLLGELYQQLSLIKTICTNTHYTIQGNVGLSNVIQSIQEMCQA